jgi:hypothetical protein
VEWGGGVVGSVCRCVGEVAQTMYTHVSKCKMIKGEKNQYHNTKHL